MTKTEKDRLESYGILCECNREIEAQLWAVKMLIIKAENEKRGITADELRRAIKWRKGQ